MVDTMIQMETPSGVRKEWFTYREAEVYCGLSRTTLWRLITEGEIDASKIGGEKRNSVRINRESLDYFLKRNYA